MNDNQHMLFKYKMNFSSSFFFHIYSVLVYAENVMLEL